MIGDRPAAQMRRRMLQPAWGTPRLGSAWAAPSLLAAAVCLVLGIVSVLTLPSLPSYDPFAWVVWGWEIAHHVIGPHEPFIAGGGPSWKPLPVVFTTIFGFFGSAAPKLWVAFARAGGLFGVFVAYRLGDRLGSSPRWRPAGPVAGVLAAFGVCTTTDWTHYMFRGTSEPIVVTVTLLAIERHLAGRRMTAFLAGVALALMRPEATLFVGLYAIWCLVTMSGVLPRLSIIAGLALIPIAWVVPPWISTNHPLLAAQHAHSYNGDLGPHVLHTVLSRAITLTEWPVIALALLAVVLALRARDRVVLALAGLSLAYAAVVVAMTLHHYPGLQRFFLPSAAIACVLAGVGVARVAAAARGGLPSLAITGGVVAASVAFFTGPVSDAAHEPRLARQAVTNYNTMVAAARANDIPRRSLPCPMSKIAINHTVQPSLAWALKLPLTEVLPVTRFRTSLQRPVLALFAPPSENTGGAPRRLLPGLHEQVLDRHGMWKVLRVTEDGNPSGNACVGV